MNTDDQYGRFESADHQPSTSHRLLPPFALIDRAYRAIETIVKFKPRHALVNICTGQARIQLIIHRPSTIVHQSLATDLTRVLNWALGENFVSAQLELKNTACANVLLLTVCLQAPVQSSELQPVSVQSSELQPVPDSSTADLNRPYLNRPPSAPAADSPQSAGNRQRTAHSLWSLSQNYRLN